MCFRQVRVYTYGHDDTKTIQHIGAEHPYEEATQVFKRVDHDCGCELTVVHPSIENYALQYDDDGYLPTWDHDCWEKKGKGKQTAKDYSHNDFDSTKSSMPSSSFPQDVLIVPPPKPELPIYTRTLSSPELFDARNLDACICMADDNTHGKLTFTITRRENETLVAMTLAKGNDVARVERVMPSMELEEMEEFMEEIVEDLDESLAEHEEEKRAAETKTKNGSAMSSSACSSSSFRAAEDESHGNHHHHEHAHHDHHIHGDQGQVHSHDHENHSHPTDALSPNFHPEPSKIISDPLFRNSHPENREIIDDIQCELVAAHTRYYACKREIDEVRQARDEFMFRCLKLGNTEERENRERIHLRGGGGGHEHHHGHECHDHGHEEDYNHIFTNSSDGTDSYDSHSDDETTIHGSDDHHEVHVPHHGSDDHHNVHVPHHNNHRLHHALGLPYHRRSHHTLPPLDLTSTSPREIEQNIEAIIARQTVKEKGVQYDETGVAGVSLTQAEYVDALKKLWRHFVTFQGEGDKEFVVSMLKMLEDLEEMLERAREAEKEQRGHGVRRHHGHGHHGESRGLEHHHVLPERIHGHCHSHHEHTHTDVQTHDIDAMITHAMPALLASPRFLQQSGAYHDECDAQALENMETTNAKMLNLAEMVRHSGAYHDEANAQALERMESNIDKMLNLRDQFVAMMENMEHQEQHEGIEGVEGVKALVEVLSQEMRNQECRKDMLRTREELVALWEANMKEADRILSRHMREKDRKQERHRLHEIHDEIEREWFRVREAERDAEKRRAEDRVDRERAKLPETLRRLNSERHDAEQEADQEAAVLNPKQAACKQQLSDLRAEQLQIEKKEHKAEHLRVGHGGIETEGAHSYRRHHHRSQHAAEYGDAESVEQHADPQTSTQRFEHHPWTLGHAHDDAHSYRRRIRDHARDAEEQNAERLATTQAQRQARREQATEEQRTADLDARIERCMRKRESAQRRCERENYSTDACERLVKYYEQETTARAARDAHEEAELHARLERQRELEKLELV